MGHPRHGLGRVGTSAGRLIYKRRKAVITGPQMRGTGGTLIGLRKITETVTTRREDGNADADGFGV